MKNIQRGNIETEYSKIREIFYQGKFNLYIKLSTEFLEKKPNDISVRFMRAKSYRYTGNFAAAIDDLEHNFKVLENLKFNKSKYLEKVKHTIVEYFSICYYLNKYEEAMKLLPILYENRFIKPISLYLMETIMRKQLGLPSLNHRIEKDEYIRNQVNQYDEIRALKHVLEHTQDEIDTDYKSKFTDNIDLNYLFETIKSNIKHENKVNCSEVLEIHYFAISNIGMLKNNSCNYIKVGVIPNTTDIISVYPVIDIANAIPQYLDCDRNKLFIKQEQKVKGTSQRDKFYNRYKRV